MNLIHLKERVRLYIQTKLLKHLSPESAFEALTPTNHATATFPFTRKKGSLRGSLSGEAFPLAVPNPHADARPMNFHAIFPVLARTKGTMLLAFCAAKT